MVVYWREIGGMRSDWMYEKAGKEVSGWNQMCGHEMSNINNQLDDIPEILNSISTITL